ncbi:MAG: 16S rRNA (uracil(1498)-N(3))-methyltransferase [Planctomycetota bacterium]
MRIPRFHAAIPPGEELLLEGEEHTHLSRVLRLRAGAAVEVFDGAGGAARGELLEVGRRESRVRLDARRVAPAPEWRVGVAVAWPKPKRGQRLVEVLTELGVDALAPLECERGVNAAPSPDKLERWALEACKQCRRDRLPRFAPPWALGALGERLGGAPALFCDTAAAPPPREALPPAPVPELWLVVGPEGGFTPREREALKAVASPVSLGPLILRIETAAAAAVAAVQALWPARAGGEPWPEGPEES